MLDSALYQTYPLAPQRRLSGHGEVDELYQTAGATGVQTTCRANCARHAAGPCRSGTWPLRKDRPPIWGRVQRQKRDKDGRPAARPAQVFLEVVPNVQTQTIRPLLLERIALGSLADTAESDFTTFWRKRATHIALGITVRVNRLAAMFISAGGTL